jgi:hypothetical protein
MMNDAVTGWQQLPEHHVVHHELEIDYGPLGAYKAANVSSDEDVVAAASDLTRPVSSMLLNPLGEPVYPKSIKLTLSIAQGQMTAALMELKLDGTIFRPGDTLTGTATVRPYRKERTTLPVRFKLPDDLPDGKYTLTACDSTDAMVSFVQENPQKFNPQTTEQLFQAVRQVVAGEADRLYLRLPLNQSDLALGQRELPDMPESKAGILAQADKLDTRMYSKTDVQSQKTDYVINGSAAASFTVQQRPKQTLLHEQRDEK